MKRKIVADSAADLQKLRGADFAAAPLKIVTAENEYVDDKKLNVRRMVTELRSYRGRSASSCPSPGDWLEAFGDGEEIFCITITSGLSGSYRSACVARELYEKMHPGRRVYVLDSLSAGPEMLLLAERIRDGIEQKLSFEDIVEDAEDYRKKTGLLFLLESMKNLSNNGRVSPLAAKAAGLLGIRVLGRASEAGELEMLGKHRGIRKVLEELVAQLKAQGYSGGRLRIAHCFQQQGAETLRQLICDEFAKARVEIYACRGLCSFYAEEGGLLVGFEKS